MILVSLSSYELWYCMYYYTHHMNISISIIVASCICATLCHVQYFWLTMEVIFIHSHNVSNFALSNG